MNQSSLKGSSLQKCALGEKFGIAVVAMRRGNQPYFTPQAEEILHSGDFLLIVGRQERVSTLNQLGIRAEPEKRTITIFGMTLVELILAPHSAYTGKTIKEMNFRRIYGFTVLAILRRGRSYRTDVGDMALEPGDSLLIVGPPLRLRDLRINPDIIIFEPDPATRSLSRGAAP